MASAPDSNLELTDDIALVEHPPEMSDASEPQDPHAKDSRGAELPEGASNENAPAWPEDQLERAVAALLFASSEPLSNARIAAVLEHTTPAHVAAALDRISARLVSVSWNLNTEAAASSVSMRKVSGSALCRSIEGPEISRT